MLLHQFRHLTESTGWTNGAFAVLGRTVERRAFEGKKAVFRQAVEELLLAPLAPASFDFVISNAKAEMLSA